MKHKRLLFYLFLLVLSSCGGSLRTTKMSHDLVPDGTSCSLLKNQIYEAKLMDVPIPLMALPFENFCDQHDDHAVFTFYYPKNAVDSLIMFYQSEMERYGWHQRYLFAGLYTLLQFEKPGKVCSISLSDFCFSKDLLCIICCGAVDYPTSDSERI